MLRLFQNLKLCFKARMLGKLLSTFFRFRASFIFKSFDLFSFFSTLSFCFAQMRFCFLARLAGLCIFFLGLTSIGLSRFNRFVRVF